MAKASEATASDLSAPIDAAWLRGHIEALCEFHRETASAGERQAAEWTVARLSEFGASARIEVADVHGTYWWSLGLAAGAGVLGGIAALGGLRSLGAALGAAGAAAIADDVPPRRRRFRRLLTRRSAFNVVATIGPEDAERTVVLVAHHDAAHSGLLFHPGIPETLHRIQR